MTRRKPSAGRAALLVREALDECFRSGRDRLPSLTVLARRADVSRATMVKAVDALKAEGAVTGRQRSGLYVGTAKAGTSVAHTATLPAGTVERVAAAIGDSIDAGRFAPGAELPPVKALAGQCGAGARTVSKALATLVARQVVNRSGRGYRAGGPAPVSRLGTVLLVCAGDEAGRPVSWTSRGSECLRAFESECSRMQQSYLVATCHLPTGRLFELGAGPVTPAELLRRPGVLGLAAFTIGTSYDTVVKLVSGMSADRRPAALLEEFGGEYMYRPSPTVRLFSMGGSGGCGRAVGAFLRSLGHRRLCYVSASHDAPWSVNRLNGLVESFDVSGSGRAVIAVTERLFHEINAIRTFALGSLAAVRRYLDEEPRRAHRQGRERLLSLWPQLQGRANAVLDDEAARQIEQPLFARALAHGDVTAWVCASDAPGVHALQFLAEQGRRVPQDISVVGFDDSEEAFAAGLTSYNFNALSVVRAMVAHILDPGRALPGRRSAGITEIEGYVTVRRTTGRR